MKTGDLITSYLDNEMNPEQEREFLLSVAASDSLRLALKSHVMLDRIVTRQAQQVHVPDPIRENIFAQMSASVGSAPHGVSASRAVSHAAKGDGSGGSTGLFGRSIWKFGRGAMVMVMTACGFAAGYYVHSPAPQETAGTRSGAIVTPQVGQQTATESVQAPQLQAPAPEATTGSMPSSTESPAPSGGASASGASASSSRVLRTAGISRMPNAAVSRRVGTVTEPNAVGSAPSQSPSAVQQAPATQPTPLDPTTTSKPTVTSGATSSQESQPNTVTLDGTIKNSRGGQQQTLPPEDHK